MLKRLVFIVFCLLAILTPMLMGGAIISTFQGEAGFNRVELKWIVTAETNLRSYQVLRSLNNREFENIAIVSAKPQESGEKTYTFTDNSVFKQLDRSFYYKLRLIHEDGSTTEYDKVLCLTPQISSARQTWGSIKAMFR
jgi:hypothetical protein